MLSLTLCSNGLIFTYAVQFREIKLDVTAIVIKGRRASTTFTLILLYSKVVWPKIQSIERCCLNRNTLRSVSNGYHVYEYEFLFMIVTVSLYV